MKLHKNICNFFRWDFLLITIFAYIAAYIVYLIAFCLPPLNPVAKSFANLSLTDVYFKILNNTIEKDTW